MRALALILFLAFAGLRAEDRSMTNRDWVSEPVSAQFSKFQSVTVRTCPSDGSILATYCEREKGWWGHMRVFKQSGDRVEWAAGFPDDYVKARGHYVESARWISCPMIDHPVLELVESTHMGNGSLWLLELVGQEFRLILKAPVLGRCWSDEPEFGIPPEGEARFKEVRIEYVPENHDENATVKLSGSLEIMDMAGNAKPPCGYEQRCVWNRDKRIFEVRRPHK
jgi:hypothetical protein